MHFQLIFESMLQLTSFLKLSTLFLKLPFENRSLIQCALSSTAMSS